VTDLLEHAGPALEKAAALLDLCRARRLTLVTAESCTGGLVAALLTALPGASDVVAGGYVTYSNDLKQSTLGISLTTLDRFGAVSAETAREMAEGAYRISGAGLSLAVTGIAGPGGGSPEKPVGTIWLATAGQMPARTRKLSLAGTRTAIRSLTVLAALGLLAEAVADAK
jgi:nicotinamide-nucleotide amidase